VASPENKGPVLKPERLIFVQENSEKCNKNHGKQRDEQTRFFETWTGGHRGYGFCANDGIFGRGQ
jgi:hypothetical protein